MQELALRSTYLEDEAEPRNRSARSRWEDEEDYTESGTEAEAEVKSTELDSLSLFSAEVAQTTLLTREEEAALAKKIARARRRIRAILRRARRLSRAALADAGRGTVTPEEDFRERETVRILRFAREAAQNRALARRLGYTRTELRAFIRELTTALEEYRVLRDRMVEANVRLVSMLARRYHHPSLTYLDLVQEGTLGLLRAVEKYEPGKNVKFSTYAVWWIWQQLARAADTQGSLIRTPVHWNQFRRRIRRGDRGPDAEGNRAYEVAAAEDGMDPARAEMMAQAFHFVSTDSPVNEDDDRPLETLLPGEGVAPEEQAFQSDLRRRLEEIVTQLPDREAEILRQRFGLYDDQAQTLEEIGERLGVSRERVRQLESRALRRLKELCSSEGLQDYLN